MIEYNRYELDNGLIIIVHEDRSTPLVAMNILYYAGSRDEDPELTGMAHLFEHLMFGGTGNIPDFDKHLLLAGGDNNAFTNSDITDYYITIPSANIETAFWLESDRMNLLDFSQRNLDIQKNVVIEEFNQRYLNQPYGDAMLLLRPLAYKVHPYRWPTIGMDISHINNATQKSITEFFFSHYAPNNAILSLTGNITAERAVSLAEKWFGLIDKRTVKIKCFAPEPAQTEPRYLTVEKDVPVDALYMAWHICHRTASDYYTLDLLTDILSGGESGRLYTKLVKEKKIFTDINAYISSDIDPGLMIIQGRLMNNINLQAAEESVIEVLDKLKEESIPETEMEKVKNRYESASIFANTSILNKAMNLSFFEVTGNAGLINSEVDIYRNIDNKMVTEATTRYINPLNCSTLYYKSSKKRK